MSLKDKALQSPALRKASHWWYGLSDRDRDALKYLAIALVLIFLYLLVWLPVQNFKKDALADVERQSQLLSWIRQNEATARELAARGGASPTAGLEGQSMLAVVGSSAKSFSIEMRRFEPEGDNKMRVWLEKVPFNQLLLWLDDMKKRYGIQAEQISVDRDETPGVISARMSLVVG